VELLTIFRARVSRAWQGGRMWILVKQRLENPGEYEENWVNMDLVERVHPFKNGLMLHLQSGQMVQIDAEMDWWKNQIDVSKDQR
jgi:hypothetical protein